MEFENDEDRSYYLEKDPAHVRFVQCIESSVENVQALDFEAGQYFPRP